MSSTVRAEFSTSSGSSQPCGLPVSTAQNWQARVQTLPINMIVAVPLFQHSPMFGQIDSSQTVASRCSRTVARRRSNRSPLGMRAFSHDGFGSRGACWRSARAFTPFLIAANPCSVWYFVPVDTTGMPRNSLIVLANIEDAARNYLTPSERGVMGRYRAPRPPSAKYITPEGAARLKRELDELWRVKRPAVTRAVSEAAAQGDRSENAEYIYGKKQLAEIDRRVRYLRKRLESIRIVNQLPADTSKVFFGAWFELAAEGGKREYRLVGPDEIDDAPDYVSVDSPLGRAVLGKGLGVEIVVRTPEGERCYEVTAIRYV